MVSYVTITGTHQGKFMGLAPTGKSIEVKTIDIIRFQNGMAVEHWGVTDALSMMQQLRAIPMKEGSEGM